MYWSFKTRVDFIASSMSISWFDEIVSVLHFNNNNNVPDRNNPLYNKCFKIQPLIDHFREKFFVIIKFAIYMSLYDKLYYSKVPIF